MKTLGEAIGFIGLLVFLAAMFVLFAGTPDVHDGLVAWVQQWSAPR
jgi:hypothetical protein